MKKLSKYTLLLASLLVLGACTITTPGTSNNASNSSESVDNSQTIIPGSGQEVEKIDVRELYTNKFGEDRIPGQWKEYGIGDPFVYRFNGKYYLYASTKNYEVGVRGWVSDDLMNWEKITGEGLQEGYVSVDPCTVTAYAPELIYSNGYFYMAQSQGGSGHYILRSDKPEGPFVAITGNIGQSIDGSFFADDDEQIYFSYASNNGIRISKVRDDFTNTEEGTVRYPNADIGGWTEGPYILKRNGIYYLTYTGNNVTSEGYRIAYSYAEGDIYNRDAFSKGELIILNTDSDFKGLGHSSTVMGPDMDSYYIAYHNLNSAGGPNRSFNISRLQFDGSEMKVIHPELNNNFAPRMPEFTAENAASLTKEGSFLLSDKASNDVFTSEFNFVGSGVKAIFSYEDASNYAYVDITGDKNINLYKVVDGETQNVQSVQLNKDYNFDVLHTLRIDYKDENLNVYFDNMCKISNQEITLNGGKIGYIENSTNIYFTAFSNVAQGSSDNEEVHQDEVIASNYYSSKFTNGSGLVPQVWDEDSDYNGKNSTHDVVLKNAGDYAEYKIWVENSATYGLDIILDKKYCGRKVQVQIDNNDIYRMTIPEAGELYAQYAKLHLGDLDISEGAHYLKIICDGQEVAYHLLQWYESSSTWPLFENDLSDYVLEGATYINTWKINKDGHYALSGNRNLMYFGNGTFTDFTMEVDIELVGETQASSCGVIIRADNPAFAAVDTVTSIQGYYIGFNDNKIFITKCNYNNSLVDISAASYDSELDTPHHLKIVARGNKISLDFDNGTKTLEFYDDYGFTHGNIGFYTDGAASIYRNLKIYY